MHPIQHRAHYHPRHQQRNLRRTTQINYNEESSSNKIIPNLKEYINNINRKEEDTSWSVDSASEKATFTKQSPPGNETYSPYEHYTSKINQYLNLYHNPNDTIRTQLILGS